MRDYTAISGSQFSQLSLACAVRSAIWNLWQWAEADRGWDAACYNTGQLPATPFPLPPYTLPSLPFSSPSLPTTLPPSSHLCWYCDVDWGVGLINLQSFTKFHCNRFSCKHQLWLSGFRCYLLEKTLDLLPPKFCWHLSTYLKPFISKFAWLDHLKQSSGSPNLK